MQASSTRSSAPPSIESFRTDIRAGDPEAIARLARATGVFSEAEIAIAHELAAEALAKGSENSGYHFLIADGAPGIEGYACFGPIPGTVARWELYWIAVAPGTQRSRLGARLQRASEDAARAMGGRFMIAETSMRSDYEPARRFYRAQGYALVAEIADWHDDGDGLAIFRKPL